MDNDDQVNQLIERSLGAARSVIKEGGPWEPLVHVVHARGVTSLRAPELHTGSAAKAQAVAVINSVLSADQGVLLITVSDVWIGDTPDGFVAISWDIPFSDRRKALLVEVQGCCDQLVCGIQRYRRSADGQVHFDEFCPGPPLR